MLASICGHFDNRLIPCLLLSFVALGTWCLVGVKLPSIARMLACFYRLMLRWSLRCYSLRSPDRMRSCFYPWAPGCLVASTLASTLASMLTSSLGLASTPLAVTRLISRGLRSLGAWIVGFFSIKMLTGVFLRSMKLASMLVAASRSKAHSRRHFADFGFDARFDSYFTCFEESDRGSLC
jgi:hypothetical protein